MQTLLMVILEKMRILQHKVRGCVLRPCKNICRSPSQHSTALNARFSANKNAFAAISFKQLVGYF